MGTEDSRLFGLYFECGRLKESLHLHFPGFSLGFDLFKQNALMSGMLVDKVQSVRPFGDDIIARQLPQDSQKGQGNKRCRGRRVSDDGVRCWGFKVDAGRGVEKGVEGTPKPDLTSST